MFSRFSPVLLSATLLCGVAAADVPNVAVDIAPVHSLVARVMEGVGSPDLIVPSGASPHEYSLRPSEASALQEAQVVFWVSSELTPWLDDAIHTLAEDATVTELLEVEGIQLLSFREGVLFEAHDHGDEEHDEHDEEAHHEDDHEHHHGDHDPHAWLSPDNAISWLKVIAAELSAMDPDNASAYFSNAAAARAELEALTTEIDTLLDSARGSRRFIVFHDAYQYFEVAFDFPAAGAISLGDASDPSPARIAEIQGRIRDEGIDCVLAEPQFNPGLVATVLDGTEAATAVLDPLGSDLEPGPALYPTLLRNLATALSGCF